MLAGPTDSFKCCHWRPRHSCCYGVKQGLDFTGHACPPHRLSGILCGDPNRLSSGSLPPTYVEDACKKAALSTPRLLPRVLTAGCTNTVPCLLVSCRAQIATEAVHVQTHEVAHVTAPAPNRKSAGWLQSDHEAALCWSFRSSAMARIADACRIARRIPHDSLPHALGCWHWLVCNGSLLGSTPSIAL